MTHRGRKRTRKLVSETLEARRLLAGLTRLPDLQTAFNADVALDGDYAVVGDPFLGSGTDRGAAYVLQRDDQGTPDVGDDEWEQVATLQSSEGTDLFGGKVAIQGNTILVGRLSTFGGSFVFEMPAGGWSGTLTETAYLDGVGDSFFLMDGGQTVVNGQQIYRRPAAGWVDSSVPDALLPTFAAAVDGDVIVGSIFVPFEGITLEVYEKPAGGWSGKVAASAELDWATNFNTFNSGFVDADVFGDTIAISRRGLNAQDETLHDVQIFEKGVSWSGMETPDARISQQPGQCDFYIDFQYECYWYDSLHIDDDFLFVGATTFGKTGTPGKYYVYEKPSSGWSDTSNVDLEIESDFDNLFGRGIASDGSTYLLFSPFSDFATVYAKTFDNTPPSLSAQAFDIDEDSNSGDSIGTISAFDPDPADVDNLTFTVLADNSGGLISLDSTTGELTLAGSLDFESANQYALTVEVADLIGATDTATITININDVNEAPSISIQNVVTAIAEDADVSTSIRVADIEIVDDALGTNELHISGPDADSFDIVDNVGNFELHLAEGVTLDFEAQSLFSVTVEVDDPAIQATPDATKAFSLNVLDVNEAPITSLANQVATIFENADTSESIRVADILVTDDALGSNGLMLSGADADSFEIADAAGSPELHLKAGANLDFEIQSAYSVSVEVDDPGITGSPDDFANFDLSVMDVNEPPELSLLNQVFTLAENVDTNSTIKLADISIADDALGSNLLSLSGPDGSSFEIVDNAGNLEVHLAAGVVVDFESQSSYSIMVEVDDPDTGNSPDDVEQFNLSISDVNELPEIVLSSQTATLREDADTAATIKLADISIVDDALGMNLLALSGADATSFAIIDSAGSPELHLAAGVALDFGVQSTYFVAVELDDPNLGNLPDDIVQFQLSITPANVAPEVSLSIQGSFLAEDSDTTSTIKLADILVSDDAVGTNNLSLSGADANSFVIVAIPGSRELHLAAGIQLDFEMQPTYTLTVEVDDPTIGDSPDSVANYSLTIVDVNEAPTVSLTNVISLTENTDTTNSVRIADINVNDDALGMNQLSLTGVDAESFQIVGNELHVAADVELNFETQSTYVVAVAIDDDSIGGTPDSLASLTWQITDANEPPTSIELSNLTLTEGTDTTAGLIVGSLSGAGDPDAIQNHVFSISGGVDQTFFSVIGDQLIIDDGILNIDRKSNYQVEVMLKDGPNSVTRSFEISVDDPLRYVIGDFVWFDLDGDGLQASDPGRRDVVVRLLDSLGSQIDETTTNDDGFYFFDDLLRGSYIVEFVAPAGFAFSPQGVGEDSLNDSDADPISGRATVFVSNAVDDFSIDAGLTAIPGLGSIRGIVWQDDVPDGISENAEELLDGVEVELLNVGNDVIQSTTTEDGSYEFTGVDVGDYRVRFALPRAYSFTLLNSGADEVDSDANPTTGFTEIISVGPGQSISNVSAGLIRQDMTSSVSGLVWNDLNGNGIRDSGEVGLGDIAIDYYDASGTNLLGTESTDDAGYYSVGGLDAGIYVVEIAVPDGYRISARNQGGNVFVDSDIDPDGRFRIVLGENQNAVSYDAALFIDPETGSIGDRVWHDLNANGIQDAGEPGIEGVVIDLSGRELDESLRTRSDEQGRYSFAGLPTGTYRLRFQNLFEQTIVDQGSDERLDSDLVGKTTVVVLGPGENNSTIDGGFVPPETGRISGRVSYDECTYDWWYGTSCRSTGTPNSRISLYYQNEIVARVSSSQNGYFSFNGLPTGSYEVCLGGSCQEVNVVVDETEYVRFESRYSGSSSSGYGSVFGRVWNDLNKNGQQDAGESGLSDTLVELQNTQGKSLRSVRTNEDGSYQFVMVPSGTYRIQVVANGGYHFSPQNQTSDFRDSDVNPFSGVSSVAVGAGVIRTIDAGLFENTSTIGDSVWEDRNGNGVRDPAEPGIDGVTVHLFDHSGVNLLDTTTTSNGGHYFFGFGDVPGDYVVEFELPSGYEFTSRNMGVDDRLDSDADVATGRVQLSLAIEEKKVTIDAGMVRSTDAQLSTISEFVWHDVNGDGVQGDDEPGMDGVIVELYRQGIPLGITTTSRGGLYSFQGLSQGDYTLQFIPPRGFDFAPQGAGDSATDSDPDSVTGLVDVSLDAGVRLTDVDAGFVELTSGEIATIEGIAWDDLNADGIRDVTEPVLKGVKASIFTTSPAFQINEVTTDENGRYVFRELPAGDYFVSFVSPFGYEGTAANQGVDDSMDSDVDPLARRSANVTLASDSDVAFVDAGFTASTDPQAATIASTVWEDENGNGIQDQGEPGIDGVVVQLLDDSGTTILSETTTKNGGEYRFPGLTSYNFVVQVRAPFGYKFAPQMQGVDSTGDSDVDALTGRSDLVTLLAGSTAHDIDVGLIPNPPERLFVSGDFTGILPGDDPDGPGPATYFGLDAFATIQDAIDALSSLPDSTVIELAAGSFSGFNFNLPGRSLNLDATIGGVAILDIGVSNGTMIVDGDVEVPGGVVVDAGGVLAGNSHIDGTVIVNSGGQVSPGVPFGILTIGDLVMSPSSVLSLHVDGDGLNADQLKVDGLVNLNDGALQLVPGISLSAGVEFILIDNDESEQIVGNFFGIPEGGVVDLDSGLIGVISYVGGTGNDVELSVTFEGDFVPDGELDCSDIDSLSAAVAAGSSNSAFDLNGDALIDLADIDEWLAVAGDLNLGEGRSYLRADANLDGLVDGSDFNVWNGNKFTFSSAWCSGDFNADGVIDGSDFNIWNANKFQPAEPIISSRAAVGKTQARDSVDESEAADIARVGGFLQFSSNSRKSVRSSDLENDDRHARRLDAVFGEWDGGFPGF